MTDISRTFRKIGAGGMAVVYAGYHEGLGKNVAIKQPTGLETAHRKQFVEEAMKMAEVDHGNVLKIYQVEFERKSAFEKKIPQIIMELADGGTLLEKIKSFATPEGEAVGILRQVLRGLQAIHDSDIIHRDIKPANILCCGSVYKIGDFGIAKMPDEKTAPYVTWKYAAPECLRGEPATKVSDIYSLGIVAYEILLGIDGLRRLVHRTWRGASSSSAAEIPWLAEDPALSRPNNSVPWHLWQGEIVELPPPHQFDASISKEVSQVVAGMCRKQIRDRYGSCRDTLDALTSVMGTARTEPHPGPADSGADEMDAPDDTVTELVEEEPAAVQLPRPPRPVEPGTRKAVPVPSDPRPGVSAGLLLKVAGALILLLSLALIFLLIKPEAGDELLERGLERLAAGDFAGSASDFESVLRRDPDDFEAALGAAKAEYRLTNYGAAEQLLGRLQENRPRNPEISLYLGLIDLERKRFGDAAAHLERATEYGSGRYPDAHFFLGFAYFEQHSWSQSRVEFKRFLRLVSEGSPLVPRARAFLDKLDSLG